MVRIARMFIILLFGVAAGAPLQANIPSSERDALIAIYNATGGPNWHHNYGWLGSPGGEGAWCGVIPNEDWSQGFRLRLDGNGPIGSSPNEITQ
ncbi:MAG TPA: hypothetical protein PL011_09540 [Kiritimatiellia bacterium]|jgi:hypothetical protein|nr:hypothetical protein [Kiritimatiellia bacterium]HPB27769.1 hypothetical protein [Acidobacteriota bacterium]HQP73739.1 hypothetical protein [Acidobacteriota bacterium]